MKQGSDARTQRIADLIQQSLADIITKEMGDTRFHLVTITGVTVARDLSYAKIYVSFLFDEEKKIRSTVRALNHAAKKLRYELAQRVKLRIIPTLKFIYDQSSARGAKVSILIDEALKKTVKQDKS